MMNLKAPYRPCAESAAPIMEGGCKLWLSTTILAFWMVVMIPWA